MAPEVGSAIVGAVGSMAGNVYNSIVGKDNSAQAFSRQKELMAIQQRYAVENWQRETGYNDPAAQMERLRRAGLNPNLVYGNGAAGLTAPSTAAPTAPGAPMTPSAPADFSSIATEAAQVAQAIATAKKSGSETVAQNLENKYLLETLKERVRSVGLANDWTEQDLRRMDQEITNYTNQWSLWANQIEQMRSQKKLTDKEVSWYDRHMNAEIADLKASKEYKEAMAKLTDQERKQAEQLFTDVSRLTTAQAGLAERALDIAKTYGDAQAIIGMLTQVISSGSELLGVLLKKTPAGMVINNIIKPPKN